MNEPFIFHLFQLSLFGEAVNLQDSCDVNGKGWGFAVGRQKDKGKQKVREKVAVLVLNSWDLSEKLIAHQCPAETPLRKSACPRQQKRGMRSRSVSVSRRDMKLKKRGAKRKLR